MKKKIFIAGPMTGIPEYNRPAFLFAEEFLAQFYEVLNPARNFDGRTDLPWHMYMGETMGQVLQVNKIYMLNGWRKSKGATIEHLIASAMGIPIFNEALRVMEPESDYLPEATRLVFGSRGEAYGPPHEDFMRQWQIASRMGVKMESPLEVAKFMMAVKLSREINKPHRDNMVDLAGYVLCYKKCLEAGL